MRRLAAVLVAVLTASSPLHAQSAPAVGYKDPGLATLASVLITGGGHFYSGETGKGATLLGIGMASMLVAVSSAGSASVTCGQYSCEGHSGVSGGQTIGLLGMLGAWGYGIYDGPKAAARHNAKLPKTSVSLLPVPARAKGGKMEAALRLTIRR